MKALHLKNHKLLDLAVVKPLIQTLDLQAPQLTHLTLRAASNTIKPLRDSFLAEMLEEKKIASGVGAGVLMKLEKLDLEGNKIVDS